MGITKEEGDKRMIFSSIYAEDDCNKYPLAIQKAINYLKTHEFYSMEAGDYEIEGEKMFAKVFDITSKVIEQTHPEFHKKYIDVQYWVSGEELCGIAPAAERDRIIEADKSQDLYFLEDVEGEGFIKARKGCYAVFFPNDVHRPGIAVHQPLTYRKVVVKVSTELL